MSSQLLCHETMPLLYSPIVAPVVADSPLIASPAAALPRQKRRRGADAPDFNSLAVGAQTPQPPNCHDLALKNRTPAALEETSDDEEWPTRVGRRDKWTCAQTGIATLCSALAVTAADRSPMASPKWHWSGWWSLSEQQTLGKSLQMYAQVAGQLRDMLRDLRDAAAAAADRARRARFYAKSNEDRVAHGTDVKRFVLQVEALSDGLIGLYVTQALDWTLSVQQSSICVAQNASLVHEELRGQTLALACAALALVCKAFHSDMDVDVDPERCVLARAAHCTVRTLDDIERLLLRAIDYRVQSMGDCFTILAYHSETLPIDAAAMSELRNDARAIERLGDRLYRMMTSDVEVFASLSPWARLSCACIEEVRERYSTPMAALYELEQRAVVTGDTVVRVAPTENDAKALCAFLNL